MTIGKSQEVDYIKLASEVLKTCESKAIPLNAITPSVVSDIPVLLATLIVELYISHLIKLPEEASNIDTIKNKVLLTSCKFLQGPNVLFIKGFICKKIYYASKAHENSRYYKVDIPFECTTTVILNNSKALPILDNTVANVKYSNENKLLSNDVSDFNQKSTEFFNKQPSCELISSKITEQCKYIYKDDKACHVDPLDIKEIIELDNNMAIMLEIQILQNQQVYIKPYCTDKQEPSSGSHKSSSDNKSDIENEPHDDTKLDPIDTSNLEDKSKLYDKTNIKNKPALDSLYNESDDDNNLDPIDNPNLENISSLFDKIDIKNKPALDSLCNESDHDNKLDLTNNTNLENKSSLFDKTDIKNKPVLDCLYNESDDDNKLDLIDNPNLSNISNLFDKIDIKNKPVLDCLCNECNYNDKLDLDYLLNFYSEPDDDNEFDLVNNTNLENKSNPYDNVHIDDKPNFNNLSSLFNKSNNGSKHDLKDISNLENTSNLYNKAPVTNKLDFISLFSLFNRSNSGSNHDFKGKPNLQNKSNLYNNTPINNKSHFNNYHNYDARTNSRGNYSAYNYRSNSYKLLILILCIFILYNLNNHNSYL